MTQTAELAPIVRTVVVNVARDEAFTLFTAGIARWWPLTSHSVFGDEATSVVFEGRADGRIYETTADGRESEWGRVLAWEPYGRVAFDWSPEPGQKEKTLVEVTFTAEGDSTRVDLTHRGWERLGDVAEEKRSSYASNGGWTQVLGALVEATER